MILLANRDGPDQTAWMRRLIRAFDVRICQRTQFCMATPRLKEASRLKAMYRTSRYFSDTKNNMVLKTVLVLTSNIYKDNSISN